MNKGEFAQLMDFLAVASNPKWQLFCALWPVIGLCEQLVRDGAHHPTAAMVAALAWRLAMVEQALATVAFGGLLGGVA